MELFANTLYSLQPYSSYKLIYPNDILSIYYAMYNRGSVLLISPLALLFRILNVPLAQSNQASFAERVCSSPLSYTSF